MTKGRKPEQKAWDNLRPVLDFLSAQYDRIETRETASGVPDVAYSWVNGHGWIELKADLKCCSVDERLDLEHYSAAQRRWHRTRTAHTPLVLLAVMVGHGWYFVPGRLAWTLPGKPTHDDMISRGVYVANGMDVANVLRTKL